VTLKTEPEYDPAAIAAYRQDTGASMAEARKHFRDIHRYHLKDELEQMIDSGDPEELREAVRVLLDLVFD